MADDMILPLLGYNDDDEEDDTTDSDGKLRNIFFFTKRVQFLLNSKKVLVMERRMTPMKMWTHDNALNTTQLFPLNTTIWAKI